MPTKDLAPLLDENPWIEPDILHRVATRVQLSNASHTSRQVHLLKIADRFNDALAPYTACKPGCSHCCHMPTLIYAHEAERLAAASGRQMQQIPPRLIKDSLTTAAKFSGTPCPFLSDAGLCLVYSDRPLICRLHHSLNDEPNDCRVGPDGPEAPIKRYDVDAIEAPYHLLMLSKRKPEGWASIHEFFRSDRRFDSQPPL